MQQRAARLDRKLAGIYLLTPDIGAEGFERVQRAAAAALAAGVRVLQFRNKRADPVQARAQAGALRALTRARGALLIVNDDPRLALAVEADGVHLGRDDADVATARALLGPDRLIGVSCYDSIERANAAVAAGADAIAFGSVYASSTKPQAVRAPLALLGEARHRFPRTRVIAIGGIEASNIEAVAAAGAHAAALITAVFDAADPGAATHALIAAFDLGRERYEASA